MITDDGKVRIVGPMPYLSAPFVWFGYCGYPECTYETGKEIKKADAENRTRAHYDAKHKEKI